MSNTGPSDIQNYISADENGNPVQQGRNHLTLQEHLAFYETFRKYNNFEDGLINNRLVWVLTIHGFLYTSYGLTIQKQLDFVSQIHKYRPTGNDMLRMSALCSSFSQTEYFLIGIAIVGSLISLCGLIGILCAQRTMRYVNRMFRVQNVVGIFDDEALYAEQPEEYPAFNYMDRPIRYNMAKGFFLPGLAGAGSKRLARFGAYSSWLIPSVIIAGWVVSGVITIFLSKEPLHLVCGRSIF